MKYVKYLVVFAVCFLMGNVAKANSISNIDIDVYIDENGNGIFRESWNANLNQGTEGYRYIGRLGKSTISDFYVTEGGKTYEDIGEWNVNASFSEKAYKSGIHHVSSYDELCFGISHYGSHTYNLNYTINNLVVSLNDADMVFWELIPNDIAKMTNSYTVNIHSDFEYKDSLDVWGYGNKGGYAYVADGVISLSKDKLKSDEYVTVLVKFPKGTFKTENVIDKDFDYYLKQAEKGADKYKEPWWAKLAAYFSIIFNFLIFALVFWAIGKSAKEQDCKSGNKVLDFGETGRKLPKDVNLFRELPCGKDIIRAYWIAYNYKLVKNKNDFLGAILLKWLKQEKIRVESETKGFIFKSEETKIYFNDEVSCDTEIEATLYNYMKTASIDGILEGKEFEKWCKDNYTKILDWFDKVLNHENDILVGEGMLTESVKKGFLGSTRWAVDPRMKEEAIKMQGLKQFFNEFENMKDKEAIDVHLWEEYLMYAQIFGVAEKVAKQFKEMYPDVITDTSYGTVVYVNNVSSRGIRSANSERAARAAAYSGGGGGFSSGGGGHGSFGGGGGGFR